MAKVWEHCWAVMWPTPSGGWHVERFGTEKDAREQWKRQRDDWSEIELVEQYILREE